MVVLAVFIVNNSPLPFVHSTNAVVLATIVTLLQGVVPFATILSGVANDWTV